MYTVGNFLYHRMEDTELSRNGGGHTYTVVTENTTYTHNCHRMDHIHTQLSHNGGCTYNFNRMYHIHAKLSHNVPHIHKTLT